MCKLTNYCRAILASDLVYIHASLLFTHDFLAHRFSSDERLADGICFSLDIDSCVARFVLGDMSDCFGPRLQKPLSW